MASSSEQSVVESQADPSRVLSLSSQEKQLILATAKEFVHATLAGRAPDLPDPTISGTAEKIVSGAFVCLKRKGHLRSCCGVVGQQTALIRALEEATYKTVWEDIRFPPVSSREVNYLDIEVWVLANPERAAVRAEERVHVVQVGRHGLIIERGSSRGLLLPGVAVENGWDAERFLEQTCTKAGLHPSLWKDDDTALFTFEGESVHGRVQDAGRDLPESSPPWFSQAELDAYAEYCRQNIVSLAVGATPNYYLPGIPDATVSGALLLVRVHADSPPIHFGQISLRPGLPLQSTLFSLAQNAVSVLIRRGLQGQDLETVRAGVVILYDAALHGTVNHCDLAGVDPGYRSILVLERSKAGLFFDPSYSSNDALRLAAEEAQVQRPRHATVFSLETLSTESRVAFTTAPRPIRGPAERRPAMAGRFYPADPDELARMVSEMLGTETVSEPWAAAMVPHAGLIYSGQIAASVLKRIRIPKTVIVLGPKHTPHGMDWAIAPQQTWSMPGFEVRSDMRLARQLNQTIEGLELDAAAHQQEHAIEVELPFISTLAPEARVVGIAIGDSEFDDCIRFAAGLAHVVGAAETRPLLLISSDMNHFATDNETRRLDALALAALETRDPYVTYETVKRNSISMCGLLPAVIVLETLRILGGSTRAERVGYATTADVTGDPSRVVGYAGMLFE
jgi:AmmeMemoRadiSam system protein B/AmmeMemoRadiSam system protein A